MEAKPKLKNFSFKKPKVILFLYVHIVSGILTRILHLVLGIKSVRFGPKWGNITFKHDLTK